MRGPEARSMEGPGISVSPPAEPTASHSRFTWVVYLLFAYLAWALPYFATRYWPILRHWTLPPRG